MSSQPLLVNLALFVLAAAIVWYAGERLTRCVDAIAERYNLGRAFLGFLVLSIIVGAIRFGIIMALAAETPPSRANTVSSWEPPFKVIPST